MKLTIYYDGFCHVCSWEMGHFYAKPGVRERIDFVDYTAPEFDPRAEGLDRAALDRWLHVKRPDGTIMVGIDAAVEIWRTVPGWAWLARLASTPGLGLMFRLGYFCFAHVRRWLPRRRQSCPLKAPASKV
jgi:predicted DCC family thiol-disulfide oxidoreductase YuxK